MATSFGYKVLQGLFHVTRYRNKMIKDAAAGRTRCAKPKGKQASRWTATEWQGRRVWTCDPKSGPTDQVYVHQHGGGYVYGIQPIHYMTLQELADVAGITVIMPDYPLPPESRAPQIIDWADSHFDSVIEARGLANVALGGCSAGGNLSMAILQRRIAAGKDNPETVLLWSPWVDLTPAETPPTKADDYEALITPYGLEPAVGAYLGDSGMDRTDPVISPAFADLSVMPTLHIMTGQQDILFPSIETFAARAREAGKLGHYVAEPDYGHYWMFYPVPDRHPTIQTLASWLQD